MRDQRWVFSIVTCGLAIGCGSNDHNSPADAAPVQIDAPEIDAPPCDKVLLVGGMDVAAQGWQIVQQGQATITYGADYTQLATATSKNSMNRDVGAQLLLARAGTFAADEAFKLEVVMQVVAVNPHGNLDAAVAIMGSFAAPFGSTTERSEMIYVDAAKVGWADDTLSAPANALDGNYHTYLLSVDAARHVVLSIDGVATTIVRDNYVSNGTIAVGDQTNDLSIEATTRIRSVRQRCAN